MTTTEKGPSFSSLMPLVTLAVGVGALSGLVAALFRLALQHADHTRDVLIARANGWPVAGFLLVVGCAAGVTALAAGLVRRMSPQAGGSGFLTWKRWSTMNCHPRLSAFCQ